MRSTPLSLFLLGLAACGVDPITADNLDDGWKASIGWPDADPDAASTGLISDPGAISGEFTSLLYGGECVVTWQMTGNRTDCSDCEFAFEVELDPIVDPCGAGYSTRGHLMLRRGYLYFDYRSLSAYTLEGNLVTWDSRAGGSVDEPDYYGYYEYYYDYYTSDYYGQATFLAR